MSLLANPPYKVLVEPPLSFVVAVEAHALVDEKASQGVHDVGQAEEETQLEHHAVSNRGIFVPSNC